MDRVEVVFSPSLGEDVIFRNAWIPNFQARRIGSNWFCANPAGAWQLISDEEHAALLSVGVTRTLFEKLEARHLILTAHNTSSYFASYERWTAHHFTHPAHHIVITTLRCNLSCSYCHAAVVPPNAGKKFDLSDHVAGAVIEFALNSRSETLSFEFQGGESLLNAGVLRRMISMLVEAGRTNRKTIFISIQTNATLLTDELMRFFRAHDVRVGASIDGPAELHDRQRRFVGGGGSHSSAVQNTTKYDLPILPTITRHSIPFWQTVVDQQLQNGGLVVAFQNVYPINSARVNWEEVGLSFTDFMAEYDRVVNYLKSSWTENYYPLERRFKLALSKIARGQDVRYADFGNPCGMVHGQIVYHTNGDVYTCDEGRDFPEFRLGNVLTDGYDELVFGRKLRELKSLSLPNDTECMTCAYRSVCSTCPVYDRATNGHLVSEHAGTDKCLQTKYIFDTLLSWIDADSGLLDKLIQCHGL